MFMHVCRHICVFCFVFLHANSFKHKFQESLKNVTFPPDHLLTEDSYLFCVKRNFCDISGISQGSLKILCIKTSFIIFALILPLFVCVG